MSSSRADLGPVSFANDSGSRKYPTLRPRDAATLILVDRDNPVPRVLVGKRGKAHAFMPELYVFPGGRRDKGDSRARIAAPLQVEVVDQLALRTQGRFTAATANGLAVAAARELEEEVSLSLTPSEFAGQFRPDLSRLRFIARAITPPGQNRRFDTRFFVCFTDEIASDASEARDSEELHDLTWVAIDDKESVPMPRITQVVLADLAVALKADPDLSFGRPFAYYRVERGRHTREMVDTA